MQVEYYIGEVQISDSNMPDIPELECLSFEIGGDPENIYPDNISFMAQVVSSTDARELFRLQYEPRHMETHPEHSHSRI